MLNQSFTVSNFRKIFDYENRKGYYLEGRYYPEIEKLTKELKKCATEFKSLNKEKDQLSTEKYEHKKLELNSKKNKLKEQKEKLLIDELEKLCKQINKGEYSIKIIKIEAEKDKIKAAKDNKAFYSIEKSDICAYFVIKQIQYTLKKLYKVQQSNRYNIICQLRGVLNNSFPKYIIRTDIKEFYESISQDKLLKKINKDSLLMPSSKKIIRDIINEYNNLSGTTTGIPRGIGISAYLSELYLREFDEAIKKHPDIIFYARYIDDIVVIYAHKPNSETSKFLEKIREEAKNLNLLLNDNKTKEIDLITPSNKNFEYLGYKFLIESGKVKIEIGNKKIARYKKRIKFSFEEYIKQIPTEKVARKLLISRLRFLTGNTRLSNNKDNALIGIYFTNNLLTDSSCLVGIDNFLKHKINATQILSNRVKNRLLTMTFQSGWNQKRFHHFSINEIQEIVKVWKNVP